jgi:glycosyltransferase involved in cell wall biosynthesis
VTSSCDRPAFSVVICTHDRAGVLPEAIKSVLAQDFPDYELVVVDDGSTDETKEVVERFPDPRVRYVYRPNGGLSAARNTGAEAARGQLVIFLDDDDRFDPSALSRIASAVGPDGDKVVSWGASLVDDEGKPVELRLPEDQGPAFADYRALFKAGTFAVPRDLYFSVGGFDEQLRTSHQTEFALRLLPACRSRGIDVVAVDDPLIVIVRRGAGRRERNDPERLLQASLAILDRHGDQLALSPQVLSDYLATAGVAAARTGDRRQARTLFTRAARTAPRRSQRWRNRMRAAVTALPPVARRVWPPDYRAS